MPWERTQKRVVLGTRAQCVVRAELETRILKVIPKNL
jgi:hypothetical protein